MSSVHREIPTVSDTSTFNPGSGVREGAREYPTASDLSEQQGTYYPLGGHLRHYFKNWALVTNDPWVLETLQGYHINLLQVPYQHAHPLPLVHNQEQNALRFKGPSHAGKASIHVVYPYEKEQGFVSALFLVE